MSLITDSYWYNAIMSVYWLKRFMYRARFMCVFFFFQAEDGIRDLIVTGVQTCALPISIGAHADNVLAGPSDFFLDVSTAAGIVTLNGFVAQRDGQKLVISNTGANALNKIGRASCRERG